MKRTTERKWHSWLNGVALTICPSMWGRQRRLWWTSGETPLTTPTDHHSSTVERVSSTKFLGVHITEDLTWTTNTMSLSKKAQQGLHFLRRLKRASLPPPTAAKIIGAPLPSILDIFLARCSSKTNSIVKDSTHPSHSLFQLLPSGRRYRSIRARSARLLNSFFPQAVRALNSNPFHQQEPGASSEPVLLPVLSWFDWRAL